MQDAVHVVAKMRAKAGKEEDIKGLIEPLIEQTRKEKGCRRYDLFQGRQDPSVITLIEEWDTEEDLRTHMTLPHLQQLFAQLPGLLAAPTEVMLYKKIA